MKTCKKCNISKSFNEFNKAIKGKDGYKAQCRVCVKQYRLDNIERLSINERSRRKTYYSKNKNTCAVYSKEYRKDNAELFAFYTSKRRAALLDATPKWLTPKHLNEIKEFYFLAKELSWLSESPLEVDHIEPLQGRDVRGLHVPWNLQILPKIQNLQKGIK